MHGYSNEKKGPGEAGLQWANENNIARPMTREQLGKMMSDMYEPLRPSGMQPVGEVQNASAAGGVLDMRNRPPGYALGNLDEARAAFESLANMCLPWK